MWQIEGKLETGGNWPPALKASLSPQIQAGASRQLGRCWIWLTMMASSSSAVIPSFIRAFIHHVSSERLLCARQCEPGLRRRTEPAESPAPWNCILVLLSGARSSALSLGPLLRQTFDHPIEAPRFGTLLLHPIYGLQTAHCCEIFSLDYFSRVCVPCL